MKATQPSDWKTVELPSKRTTLTLDREFSKQEMEKIRRGILPRQMEDKWFIYWKDGDLFFHRSWTGFCTYIVHFNEEENGSRMVKAEVNRDPDQYSQTDDAYDAKMISYLVDILLLEKESIFPSTGGSPADQAVANWSMVGRAMFGKDYPEGIVITKKGKEK
jgi:hypothetical protein